MDQPVPTVSEQDVMRIVRRDFTPDRFDVVMAILNEYGTDDGQRGRHRVRLAVLKLADGNLDAIRRHVEIAKHDDRDVLASAEYPGYMRIPPSDEIGEPQRQRIIHADWDQYQTWLNKK